MTYDKMAVLLALIGARMNSNELKAIVDEFEAATEVYSVFPCEVTRVAVLDAEIELKDAYEENRR